MAPTKRKRGKKSQPKVRKRGELRDLAPKEGPKGGGLTGTVKLPDLSTDVLSTPAPTIPISQPLVPNRLLVP